MKPQLQALIRFGPESRPAPADEVVPQSGSLTRSNNVSFVPSSMARIKACRKERSNPQRGKAGVGVRVYCKMCRLTVSQMNLVDDRVRWQPVRRREEKKRLKRVEMRGMLSSGSRSCDSMAG